MPFPSKNTTVYNMKVYTKHGYENFCRYNWICDNKKPFAVIRDKMINNFKKTIHASAVNCYVFYENSTGNLVEKVIV
jgi:hypothetical protein